ncbi:MAG: hypothetical protein SGPRY_002932 [Prymnesium sp.]
MTPRRRLDSVRSSDKYQSFVARSITLGATTPAVEYTSSFSSPVAVSSISYSASEDPGAGNRWSAGTVA